MYHEIEGPYDNDHSTKLYHHSFVAIGIVLALHTRNDTDSNKLVQYSFVLW